MQINFNPVNTSGLSDAFRTKPVASGVLAVFSGGRRPDRYFAAWLMAGELGMPLVQSSVPVPGCLAFVERQAAQVTNPGAVSPSTVLSHGPVLSPGVLTFPGFGLTASKPLPGAVTILSLTDPAPEVEAPADLVIHFSAAGRQPVTPPLVTASLGSQDRIDPCCHFNVAIDGHAYGFSEVAALSCASYGPRGAIYPNIILRRAITLNKDLYGWRMNLAAGQADVRSVTIAHLTASSDVVRSWWIEGAWPVRWSGPSLDSMASRPAMEEIEICVSRFDWR